LATVHIKNRTRARIAQEPLRKYAAAALDAAPEWRGSELSITFVGGRVI